MGLLFWIIVLAVSLVVLLRASDFFIDGAERLGLYFKIPPFIIGVFVLGFGTSLPELVVSITSVIQKAPEIVIGNVLGSNITNVFLILGIAAIVVKESKIHFDFLSFDMPLAITSAFFITVTIWDGVFSVSDAIIFLAIFLVYIIYTVSHHKKTKEIVLGELEEIEKEKPAPVPRTFRHNLKNFSLRIYSLARKRVQKINWLTVAKVVVSPFFIYLGAEYAVEAVIKISDFINIGSDVIAASVVALGTSLPELSVSYVTLKKGKIDEMLGNILGSGIFNILVVTSIPALIAPIAVPQEMIKVALPIMLVATVIFFIFAYDKKITRGEGIVLLIFYALYLGLIFNFF